MQTADERRTFWAEHIKACSESGLTKVAYCQQHGLKIKSFYYWQRRNRPSVVGPVTLVPVSVKTFAANTSPDELVLRHHTGWSLQLPSNLAPA
jgi:hypothetical protein